LASTSNLYCAACVGDIESNSERCPGDNNRSTASLKKLQPTVDQCPVRSPARIRQPFNDGTQERAITGSRLNRDGIDEIRLSP